LLTMKALSKKTITVLRKDTSVLIAGGIVASAIRLMSTVILTRILTPVDYGVVGILLSIGYTANMLSDVGIFGYVVRHSRSEDKDFLDQMWTIRLVRSVVLMVLVIIFSPVLAWILAKPITLALMIYALTFGFEGITSMAFATAVKQRQMTRIVGAEISIQIILLPITILLAIWLRSYWALVVSILIGAMIEVIFSYKLYPNAHRKWNFNAEESRNLWYFGRAVGASSIIYLILTQIDKFALARLLPTSNFGLYVIATTLVSFIRTFNGRYVERILFPAFANVKDASSRTQSLAFYSTGKPARLLYSFASGGFFACAPLAISLLYDPRFSGATLYLQILAVGNFTSMSTGAANQMLIALGRTRHVFNLNLVRLISFLVVGSVGLWTFGPLGLVAAVSGMELAAQAYCWTALARVGVLDPAKEVPYWAITLIGFCVGWIVNSVGMNVVG
jgi:lipopolysaccharide exporter